MGLLDLTCNSFPLCLRRTHSHHPFRCANPEPRSFPFFLLYPIMKSSAIPSCVSELIFLLLCLLLSCLEPAFPSWTRAVACYNLEFIVFLQLLERCLRNLEQVRWLPGNLDLLPSDLITIVPFSHWLEPLSTSCLSPPFATFSTRVSISSGFPTIESYISFSVILSERPTLTSHLTSHRSESPLTMPAAEAAKPPALFTS